VLAGGDGRLVRAGQAGFLRRHRSAGRTAHAGQAITVGSASAALVIGKDPTTTR
jgi:hypothetical protein